MSWVLLKAWSIPLLEHLNLPREDIKKRNLGGHSGQFCDFPKSEPEVVLGYPKKALSS